MSGIFFPEPFEADFIPHILKELYIEQVYEPHFLGKKDLTIFDLGGHIGLFSMYARKYAKVIHCVEPSAENYTFLRKNIEHNGWDNVKTYNVALANKDGKTQLFHSANKTAHTLMGGNHENSETVEMWTFERLMKETGEKHVDFVKMDIEGAEFGVLGGSYFKKVSHKIDVIVGEMHSWSGRNYNQVKWSLKDCGFDVKFMAHDASIFAARRMK